MFPPRKKRFRQERFLFRFMLNLRGNAKQRNTAFGAQDVVKHVTCTSSVKHSYLLNSRHSPKTLRVASETPVRALSSRLSSRSRNCRIASSKPSSHPAIWFSSFTYGAPPSLCPQLTPTAWQQSPISSRLCRGENGS